MTDTTTTIDATEHAARLLELWFDGCTGLRSVSRFTSPGRGPSTDVYSTRDAERMAQAVAGFGRMFPTYVRVTTLRSMPAKRGGAGDTLELPGLYADVDGAWGEHKTLRPLPPTVEAALEPLAGLPAPTVVVDSGGGLYPLWKLEQPATDLELAADAMQRWAAELERRYDAAGYHFDRLDDLARILRWPGTLNTKRPDDPRLVHVRLELGSGARYSLDELLEHAPPLERTTTVAPAFDPQPLAAASADASHPYDALRGLGLDGQRWVAQVLEASGWQVMRASSHDRFIDLRRPGGSSDLSVRLGGVHPRTGDDMVGQAEVFSTAVPGAPAGSYTLGGFLAAVYFDGDHGRCATWLHEQHGLGRPFEARRDPTAYLEAHARAADMPVEQLEAATHLPDAFWSARPELEHIRQAARARIVSPDAVLGCVLARVAASCSHTITLPAFGGSAMGLTFLAAVVGPSGSGKSSAIRAAADLLPAPSTVLDRLPIGSGEGFVDVLFDDVKEPREDGKGEHVVRRQTKHAAIFEVDEGQVVAELGARSGATLLTTLRSAFSHGTLGQTNASKERRRIVSGESYVFGILLGFQPEHAVAMLDDAAGGTPQRLAWFSAVDPHATAGHYWPGPLSWAPPAPGEDRRDRYSIRWVRHLLGYDATIVDEVVAERIAKARGAGADDEPLDSHRTVVRLKVAALLAMLAGRLDVTVDDWQLSDDVMRCSSAVRTAVQLAHQRRQRDLEESATQRHVRRQRAVEDDAERRQLERAVSAISRRVRAHASDLSSSGHADDARGCTRRCLTQALSAKARGHLDAALDAALERQHVVVDGGRYVPGEVTP